VENAVKHGIAMMTEGGQIDISGRVEDGRLCFTISNPFDAQAPSTGRNGLGLRNVRERLESRYGGAAEMKIRASEATYSVELLLPARVER
jgi:LytS/YehU family sensor histidine kinase